MFITWFADSIYFQNELYTEIHMLIEIILLNVWNEYLRSIHSWSLEISFQIQIIKHINLMKILFNAKYVYQKNMHNSSLPRLIRFIYVNVFCQRAGINFGRVFVIQFEKKWGCKVNCVNFSHTLRMHFFPSIRILTLHLSLHSITNYLSDYLFT